MKQILVNTFLVILWVLLTIGQVRLIYVLNDSMALGTVGTLAAWLVGQLLILSPMIWIIWRDRTVGNA